MVKKSVALRPRRQLCIPLIRLGEPPNSLTTRYHVDWICSPNHIPVRFAVISIDFYQTSISQNILLKRSTAERSSPCRDGEVSTGYPPCLRPNLSLSIPCNKILFKLIPDSNDHESVIHTINNISYQLYMWSVLSTLPANVLLIISMLILGSGGTVHVGLTIYPSQGFDIAVNSISTTAFNRNGSIFTYAAVLCIMHQKLGGVAPDA